MPSSHPRFGTDGVRGGANEVLTADIALALGRAAADVLAGSEVVIGRDTRRSGQLLEAALVAAYTGAGIGVRLLGEVPTPTVAWASAHDNVAGAMISASHNPFADNGIKFFAPGGRKLTDTDEERIEERFHAYLDGMAPPLALGDEIGVVAGPEPDVADGWADAIVASTSGRRFDGWSVVLDCAHGAASRHAAGIFRRLGADVAVIGDQPDGVNINDGFGSTHPERLAEAVVASGASLGLAFDGDADRLIAVDAAGGIVDGDHILAILATDWRAAGRLRHDTVVVTVMSNLGFRLAMKDADITVVSTGVGDRYVLEALDAGGFSLGGEQSGHVICRDLATTGDGVLAAVQLLDALVRNDRPLDEWAAEVMTVYPQVLRNVRLERRPPDLLDQLAAAVSEAEAEMGPDGRVLVRPSGTEPLIRVMVEHRDAATADQVCERLVAETERLAAASAGPAPS